MSNTFGNIYKVTTFGESHGPAIGAVIDGCPALVPFCENDIRDYLAEDAKYSILRTARKEPNEAVILSGVYNGMTLGTPIAIITYNGDKNSFEYMKFEGIARPSHADYAYYSKFGIYDPRGGGRASGRECIARHFAAALASKMLSFTDIKFDARVVELCGISVIDKSGMAAALKAAENAKKEGDSTGGAFEIKIKNVPEGLGSPVFGKLDALISSGLFSIGGICGVEIGGGFAVSKLKGSEANDPFFVKNGKIRTSTNNSGGIQGGISNGMEIVVRAAVKPTPSIYLKQRTVDFYKKKNCDLKLTGRFDANFTPRAMSAALSMLRIIMADCLLAAGKVHPEKFDGKLPY